MTACMIVVLSCGFTGPENAARLSAADLPAYRAALRGAGGGDAPRVDFRTLWEHDRAYRNHRVSLQGRIVRRFSQPAAGGFPALTEFWVVNDRGEPMCVVVPTPTTVAQDVPSNSVARFQGTYLRPIRYPAAGGDRVAPLVVASSGPEEAKPSRKDRTRFAGEGWVAAALGGLVVVVLLLQFLRRPPRRVRRLERPPVFLQEGEEEASRGNED